MSDEVYLQAHKTAVEVGQKFDYWVAGIVSAVLAYSVQHYQPRKFDSLVSIIEPIALFLLFISFWFAFRKLQLSFFQASLGHDLVDHQSQLFKVLTAIKEYPQGADDSDLGFRTPEQMQAEVKEKRGSIALKKKKLETLEAPSLRAFRLRQRFFVLGFALLLIAKVTAPAPSHCLQPSSLEPQ